MFRDSERQDPGERGPLPAFAPPPRKGKYLAEPSKVVYRAKDGTEEKVFDALEWLAAVSPPYARPRRNNVAQGTLCPGLQNN